ncbi:MAG TPA: FliI/YscN family ATPase [Solirubrobacteraceae bacterium]|nr:FliI/YscN family ATPase [Solirubrobacteraceae bacterium]
MSSTEVDRQGDTSLAGVRATLRNANLARHNGRVSDLIGLIIEATGLRAEVGELCLINAGRHRDPVASEVVGFRQGRTLLMPLGELQGIGPGTKVQATGSSFQIPVGEALLGRVLDGLGRPIDLDLRARTQREEELGGEERLDLEHAALRPTQSSPPDPLSRPRITERVALGVRALDALVPCGRGQRLGIFAGSGVGKSSLLGMIARASAASVNVIALVGERGREVGEFIERDLGEGLARSVVVVATSDQPALVRIKAAFTATAIAEHFRDRGHDVMLMMDSITRFAMAQREVGLAVGEPPATRGYTPSVFALLPRLLERAGRNESGSITGLYTVLVDGDDMNEPIADAVRAILDGHIVLSRALAHAGHYPAIDVLQSVSRLADEIVSAEAGRAAQRLRAALARMREKEDLIAIGAYRSGSDPELDAALMLRGEIERFLCQPVSEASSAEQAENALLELEQALQAAASAAASAQESDQEAEVLEGEALPPASALGAYGNQSAIPDLRL